MGANRVKGLIEDNKDVIEDVGVALIDQAKEKTAAISKEINRTQADDKVGFLDIVMGKILSRKLLVFITATSLLVWAGLDSDIWGMIAMCYIGGQSAIDFAKVWKGM